MCISYTYTRARVLLILHLIREKCTIFYFMLTKSIAKFFNSVWFNKKKWLEQVISTAGIHRIPKWKCVKTWKAMLPLRSFPRVPHLVFFLRHILGILIGAKLKKLCHILYIIKNFCDCERLIDHQYLYYFYQNIFFIWIKKRFLKNYCD